METIEAIELAKSGSQKAFTYLYAKFNRSIYANIYNIVRNRDVADDLLSETFVKAFKNIDKFTKNISFEMWLKTIANNHSIDFVRSGIKNKGMIYFDDELLSDFAYTDGVTPESKLIEKEEYGNYEKGLKTLSNRSGQVLELRYKGNLTYQEIANKLGISIGTVKHYIHRYTKTLISNITNQSSKPNENKKSSLISGNQILS